MSSTLASSDTARTLTAGDNRKRELVLVVEDDPISRRLLERLLEAAGYEAFAFASAELAIQHLAEMGCGAFACLVTDYRLPGLNGLDLRAWTWLRDPTLAAVLVTIDTDRQLVQHVLRAGFVDFLNKPVHAGELRDAVSRAVSATRHQRNARNLEQQLDHLAHARQHLLDAEAGAALLRSEVYSRPKQQAGGDFLCHIPVSPQQETLMLADVSGHDLNAAYTSTYFQGMVRGMIEAGASHGEVLARFNQFLADTWAGSESGCTVSIAACSLSIDLKENSVSVICCGGPLPILTRPDGPSEIVPAPRCSPLGWFTGEPIEAWSAPIVAGHFVLWTDGVEDLARSLQVSPLSLSHALLAARAEGRELDCVGRANDDILVVRVTTGEDTHACAPRPCAYRALVVEDYRREDAAAIDSLQEMWHNSVRLCCRGLDPGLLYDAMLTAREAVLNALSHGCAEGQSARFEISCCMCRGLLRVRVSDPGTGHDFRPAIHHASSALAGGHRGLLLIEQLAHRVHHLRRGAGLVIDFFLRQGHS